MKILHFLLPVFIGVVSVGAASSPTSDLISASREALQAGEAARAVELAEQAVKSDSRSPDAHVQLGMAYSARIGQVNFMQQAMMAGRMRGAFEQAVALDPEHTDARIGLVRYYANAPAIAGGGRQKAEAEAELLRQRNPFLGLVELAFVAEKFEDWNVALGHYEKALALQPEHAGLHHRLGTILERLERRADARQHYARALALDSSRTNTREALERLGAAE
jgi:tetratricopeptide (TPR) repeat protein